MILSESLASALASGDAVLTDQGEWTRDNPTKASIDLSAIDVSHALACNLAIRTEKGHHRGDKEMVALLRKIAKGDKRPIMCGRYSFHYPAIYCKPEWVERQIEYQEQEVAKLREWLASWRPK